MIIMFLGLSVFPSTLHLRPNPNESDAEPVHAVQSTLACFSLPFRITLNGPLRTYLYSRSVIYGSDIISQGEQHFAAEYLLFYSKSACCFL